MSIKASDANELLCDNNTGKTYHVNWSYLSKKLGFLDKISGKDSSCQSLRFIIENLAF